jgi:hypothetical protein
MPGPVFLRGEEVSLHPIEEADLAFLVCAAAEPVGFAELVGLFPAWGVAEARGYVDL